MAYINFDSTRPFDVIPLGRILNRGRNAVHLKNMWEVRLPISR